MMSEMMKTIKRQGQGRNEEDDEKLYREAKAAVRVRVEVRKVTQPPHRTANDSESEARRGVAELSVLLSDLLAFFAFFSIRARCCFFIIAGSTGAFRNLIPESNSGMRQ